MSSLLRAVLEWLSALGSTEPSRRPDPEFPDVPEQPEQGPRVFYWLVYPLEGQLFPIQSFKSRTEAERNMGEGVRMLPRPMGTGEAIEFIRELTGMDAYRVSGRAPPRA
jgi:hypothetical protein